MVCIVFGAIARPFLALFAWLARSTCREARKNKSSCPPPFPTYGDPMTAGVDYHTLRDAGLCVRCGVTRSAPQALCPDCATRRSRYLAEHRRAYTSSHAAHVAAFARDPAAHMTACVAARLRPACAVRRIAVGDRQPHDAYVNGRLAVAIDRGTRIMYARAVISAHGPMYVLGGQTRIFCGAPENNSRSAKP